MRIEEIQAVPRYIMPELAEPEPQIGVCPAPACAGDQWELRAEGPAQWRVNDGEGRDWLMAGETAACPLCGSSLRMAPPRRDYLAEALRGLF